MCDQIRDVSVYIIPKLGKFFHFISMLLKLKIILKHIVNLALKLRLSITPVKSYNFVKAVSYNLTNVSIV